MKILLIKTSSMGDLVHTLPALTDAGKVHPGIIFDWVVEENLADIPRMHPLVRRVIPISLRQWRKKILTTNTFRGFKSLKATIAEETYDLIIDAQGLVKSAILLCLMRGKTAGLDWNSAREKWASLFYQEKHTVNFHQHAVIRMRSLMSQALKYPLPKSPPDFGIQAGLTESCNESTAARPYIVFLHGTTWATKCWPEEYWHELARLARHANLRVKISGGNTKEMQRAKRIALDNPLVEVLPTGSINTMTNLLANAKAVVAVDTGFAHLAAALDVVTISIYGATNAALTGAIGSKSIQLSASHPCSPCLARHCRYKGPALSYPACYATINPLRVWNILLNAIATADATI